jgi:hypothetical protein
MPHQFASSHTITAAISPGTAGPDIACNRATVIVGGAVTMSVRGGDQISIPAATLPFVVEQISNLKELVFIGSAAVGLIAA